MEHTLSGAPAIRKMVLPDLDRIIEIDIKVLGQNRAGYWKTKIASSLKNPLVSSLVAQVEGQVTGFIIGGASRWEYGVPENIGWIDTIGVDPDFRRKGIAKDLFQEMTRELKKKGVDTITTFVKRRDPDLLAFFNRLGFQKGDMVNLELDI